MIVLIEQHEELKSARHVTGVFKSDHKIADVLHSIAQKSSVDILDKVQFL